MTAEQEIAARLASSGLTLEFIRSGDRYEHQVLSEDSSLLASNAQSLETPVYQDVHQQGEIIFASGMSGDRHWSVSIEPCDNGFQFDLACRAKTKADRLGVAYQSDGHIDIVPCDHTPVMASKISKQCLGPISNPGHPPYTVRCRYRIAAGIVR